jgi:hypothetical protein
MSVDTSYLISVSIVTDPKVTLSGECHCNVSLETSVHVIGLGMC